MPVFRWFSTPDDLGQLVVIALSHPKRPEGLCVVERTARKPTEFIAHYSVTSVLKEQIIKSNSALFMMGKDVSNLEIRRLPKAPTHSRSYYVDLNNSISIVAMFVPCIVNVERHRLLHHSMLEYYPTKWCSEKDRRIKAPRETDLIFRFLKRLVKSLTQPGVEGQLMTESVQEKMKHEGLLIANNRLWYDAKGHVRGTVQHPTGFAELPPTD
jgi:hypothetical protein